MLNFFLRILEGLYLRVHRRVYRRRLADQTVFEELYVVSVGNLSAGGTGKTPVALALAKYLREREIPALAVLRGYGGSAARSAKPSAQASGVAGGLLVSDGERRLTTVDVAGDEAMLFARSPGLRVAVGRDRVGAIREFAGDARVVLLDDAFQNPLVGRDHELVLLDSLVPVHEMRVFPGGRFRDPPAALRQADTILLTRVDLASPPAVAELEALVAEVAPEVPVFRGRHRPAKLTDLPSASCDTNAANDANDANDAVNKSEPAAIGAFCGLGNPEGFFQSLATPPNEIQPAFTRAFRDHHAYTTADIQTLFRAAEQAGHSDIHFVTSAKDFARLEALPDLDQEYRQRIHVLEIEFEVLDGRGSEFFERVLGPVLPADQK
ncbi:MAG: tetraacyldisaccharide 4'-kinase [bacterium]|nr:tetraacyldisaccharide 4'-kinase [bacterium]